MCIEKVFLTGNGYFIIFVLILQRVRNNFLIKKFIRDKSRKRKQVNIRKGERWTNERSEEGDEKGEAGRQGGRKAGKQGGREAETRDGPGKRKYTSNVSKMRPRKLPGRSNHRCNR